MSGDCDICGSYDHVETGCDAFDCPTCEDEGIVVLGITVDTGALATGMCPDCRPVDPGALWAEYERNRGDRA